ncbi:MAG: DUF1611 domain-containing protein [Kordiimonas sp.]
MQHPYLLFLGHETVLENAKTATGIAYWRPEYCVGQFRQAAEAVDIGLPDLGLEQALDAGAKTLVIGLAPAGGMIDERWVPVILSALEKGMDVAAGLHHRLNSHKEIAEKAKACGRKLYDVRHPEKEYPVAVGVSRTGNRLLTVGTDCTVGKMYTSLAIEKEITARRGVAQFRATGQTGVFIAGKGICVDAIVSDFVAGAAETLTPANEAQHWDIIEGQGSIFHPSFAAVTVGLLHGCQPNWLVLCHDAVREHIEDMPDFPIVGLSECVDAYLSLAKLTSPKVQFAGVCVNTSKMSAFEAHDYMRAVEAELGLPCCDPVRNGVRSIVDQLGVN